MRSGLQSAIQSKYKTDEKSAQFKFLGSSFNEKLTSGSCGNLEAYEKKKKADEHQFSPHFTGLGSFRGGGTCSSFSVDHLTPFQAHSFDALPCSSIGSVQFCSVSNVLVRYQVKTSFGISQHLTAQHCLQCCSDIIANCSSENKLLHFKRTQGCRSFKKGNS